MTISMYDTVTVDTVPPNPQAVAGYVGGSWPTYNGLVKKFPNAYHLSIAVASNEDADCLDVEPGDASPSNAPAWVRRQLNRGVKSPAVYASLSSMPDVLRELASAGIPRSAVRVWTAHYNYTPHICNPGCGFGFNTTADATQYTDKALGRNLDESLCQDSFFVAVPPPDPYHYDWFATGPFPSKWGDLNEKQIVLRYDGARQHPIIRRNLIKALEDQLAFLAGRVFTVAHDQPVNGKPSWQLYYRGWRYQQLIHRAQGLKIHP